MHAVLSCVQCMCSHAGMLASLAQELAVLDVVATLMEEQGKGHCGALLGALEGWLGPCLGVSRLLAVCPDDVSGAARQRGGHACTARPWQARGVVWLLAY